MSKITVIIPARYASVRFPGKPLALIGGVPMIERVYRQAEKAEVDEVIAAVDDARVRDAVENFGGSAVMTDPALPNGTARCAAAARRRGIKEGFVINIQGDEPFIAPEQINRTASLLREGKAPIATLVSPAVSEKEILDPNRVKAVTDRKGRALYFSRAPLPFRRDGNYADHARSYLIHIGIYGFQAEVLHALEGLPTGTLEAAESLEQLGWLENGYLINTAQTSERTDAVDTPEDLEALQKKFFL